MMHFPGGSNTRKNPSAYKYTGKKSTDFRLPRGLEGGSQRWNWRNVRCSVRLFYKLYDVLFVRSTNSTTFCSFVLQTQPCSVRLLNKNERLFCTFDLQLNVVMTTASSEIHLTSPSRDVIPTKFKPRNGRIF